MPLHEYFRLLNSTVQVYAESEEGRPTQLAVLSVKDATTGSSFHRTFGLGISVSPVPYPTP